MSPQKLGILAAVVVLAAGLGYIISRKSQVSDSTVVIRTYKVPPGQAAIIRGRLNKMLGPNDNSVQNFNDGNIAVNATVAQQRGIAKMLSEWKDQPTANRTIHFEYWLVRAENAKSEGTTSFQTINPALEAIQKVQGAKKFTVIEHLNYTTLADRDVTIKGGISSLESKAYINNNTINAQLKIGTYHDVNGTVETTTSLKPGEVVVLGQMMAWRQPGKVAEGVIEAESKDVFHILRADFPSGTVQR